MILSAKESPAKGSIKRLRASMAAPAAKATAVSFVKLKRNKFFIKASKRGHFTTHT